MTNPLRQEAETNCRNLPPRLHTALTAAGIPDQLLRRRLIGWNGSQMTVPIINQAGEVAFIEHWLDPAKNDGVLGIPDGREQLVELYGWRTVQTDPRYVILCEGIMECLILEARGFQALTSTGNGRFLSEKWLPYIRRIPYVYLCYKRGRKSDEIRERAEQFLHFAHNIELPRAVGREGGVYDYFVRLGLSAADFCQLLDDSAFPPVFPAHN